MMTGGASVAIRAVMGVLMPGMITGGHPEGPQPHRADQGRLSEVVHVRHFDQEPGYDAGRHPDKSRPASREVSRAAQRAWTEWTSGRPRRSGPWPFPRLPRAGP